MTAKNLSTVAQDLITTYGNTARNVVNAYRQGNARAVSYLDQSWASAIDKAGQRISADLRKNAVSAQKTISAYYVRGVTLGSDRADTVVGRAVDLAVRGVDQVSANASRFEQATGITALSTIAQAAVPAAASVYQVAQRVEAQSETLVSKIAGQPAAPKSTVKRTVKRAVKRTAKATTKATPKAATKAKTVTKAAAKPAEVSAEVVKKAPRARKAA